MKRLILFEGAFDTLDLFTEELRKAFVQRNMECFVFDIRRMDDSMKQLIEFLKQPVTAVIAFNNMGSDMELREDVVIWDAFQIPYFNILMDHPFHYREKLEKAPKTSVVLCPDRNHVAYVKRFHKNILQVEYLPHGGIEVAEQKKLLPIAERPIDVLYPGALSRGIAEQLMPDFGKFTDFRADDMAQKVLGDLFSNPWKTTEEAIEEYLQAEKVEYDEERLCKIISDMRFLDSFAVSFYREQAVRILVENGIRVKVVGRGWECCDWIDHPNFDFGGLVTAQEVLELMQQSKIVLNTMTWFKDGTHDRVFNAQLAGAVAVTDPSAYMKECYQAGDGICFFDLKNLRELPAVLQKLLQEPDRAQTMANRGYEIARADHTWQKRAEKIASMFKEETN